MSITDSRRSVSRIGSLVSVALFAAVAAWLLVASSVQAESYSIDVECDDVGCYETLEAALTSGALVAGDVLTLTEGAHAAPTTAIGIDLTIRGAGRDLSTISGDGQRAALQVVGAALTLEDLTITGGESPAGGGVVSNDDLIVRNVRFVENLASGNNDGGAINHGDGELTIEDSLFEDNAAGRNGGAVAAGANATVIIRSSTFTGNTCNQGAGCGLYLAGPGAVETSLFVSPDGDDDIDMNGGTISTSSIGSWVAGTVDASGNWWGVATPVEGTHYEFGVTVDSYLSSIDLEVTRLTPTVGASITATATVRDGKGDAVVLPVRYTVSGTHTGASTSSAGGHTYAGTSAGGDTVRASVAFGDGSQAPSVPLEASAAVTWGAAAPPPPDPTPTPVPTAVLTPDEKQDLLTATGVIPDTGDPGPNFRRSLEETNVYVPTTERGTVEVPSGSTISADPTPPPSWGEEHDEMADARGLDTEPEPRYTNPFLVALEGVFDTIVEAFRGVADFIADVLETLFDFVLATWAFLFGEGSIWDVLFPSMAFTDEGAEPSPPTAPLDEGGQTVLRLEIAPRDLPEGATAEEVALVWLDSSVPRWVEVESIVTQLPDGKFAMTAWVSRTALYTVMARPLEDVPVASGLTLLTWRGVDGQPPSRALFHVDAPVQAVFRLDPETQEWSVYLPGAPAFVQSIEALRDGDDLVVLASDEGAWRMRAVR